MTIGAGIAIAGMWGATAWWCVRMRADLEKYWLVALFVGLALVVCTYGVVA